MEGWDTISAVLINGSPQTAAGEKIRIDSANDADAYPFVVGHRVNVKREFGLDNSLHAVIETYMLECWGETRDASARLSDECAALLIAAGYPLDDNGPDGLDPVVDVRCVVLYVTLFLDVPYVEQA